MGAPHASPINAITHNPLDNPHVSANRKLNGDRRGSLIAGVHKKAASARDDRQERLTRFDGMVVSTP